VQGIESLRAVYNASYKGGIVARYNEHNVSAAELRKIKKQGIFIDAVPLAEWKAKRGNKPIGSRNFNLDYWTEKLAKTIEAVRQHEQEREYMETWRNG
jgi:hypothetical protein